MIEKIRESIKDIEFYNSINDLFINNSLNKLIDQKVDSTNNNTKQNGDTSNCDRQQRTI